MRPAVAAAAARRDCCWLLAKRRRTPTDCLWARVDCRAPNIRWPISCAIRLTDGLSSSSSSSSTTTQFWWPSLGSGRRRFDCTSAPAKPTDSFSNPSANCLKRKRKRFWFVLFFCFLCFCRRKVDKGGQKRIVLEFNVTWTSRNHDIC